MKLPWVSRERYDDYVRAHRMLGEELTRERARFDALLEKYHAVLAPKWVPATPPGTADLAPREDSLVTKTIREEAGGDRRLAGYLRKRAAELRAEKKTPEEIAEQLRSWQTTETEGVA